MTPAQIGLIQSSRAKVAPIQETAATLCYGKLFELGPGVRPLSRGDVKEPGPGADFTPATREAWRSAYATLATVRQDAAHGAA